MGRTRSCVIYAGSTLLGGFISICPEGIATEAWAALSQDTSKYDRRIERQTLPTVEPQSSVRSFQDCSVISASGYVGSVIAQQTVAQKEAEDSRTTSRFPSPLTANPVAPAVPRLKVNVAFGTTPPDDRLAQAPAVPTPTPQRPPVTSNPRTPWNWIVAKSPYRCAIGSATVSVPSALGLPLKPGDVVELRVTTTVLSPSYYSLAVEDTYRMAARGNEPVSFPKIAVAAIFVGTKPDLIYSNTVKAITQIIRTGAFVGFQGAASNTPGGRLVCTYKPQPNQMGAGSISCKPGAPWPLRR